MGVSPLVVEVIKATRAPFSGFAGFEPAVIRYFFLAMALVTLVMARVWRARAPAVPAASRDARAAPGTGGRAPSDGVDRQPSQLRGHRDLGPRAFPARGSSRDCYLFLRLSVLGFAVNFPRWSEWKVARVRLLTL